jgi:hypothetical protein
MDDPFQRQIYTTMARLRKTESNAPAIKHASEIAKLFAQLGDSIRLAVSKREYVDGKPKYTELPEGAPVSELQTGDNVSIYCDEGTDINMAIELIELVADNLEFKGDEVTETKVSTGTILKIWKQPAGSNRVNHARAFMA